MKIKEGFILREVADSYLVVAVGDAVKTFNGIINLNQTGAFMWKCIQKGYSEQQLVNALLDEYDVTEELARNDANEFISKLVNAGLIEK